MTDTRTQCDDSQLLAMLRTDDNLSSQQSIVGHVETCERCQVRLAELAAGDDQWEKVASALSDHGGIDDGVDAELEQTVTPRLSHLCDRSNQWTESMVKQLLDPPSHPEMLGRLGRYEIERLIGSGGMGIVFKAHDTELNRPVAIKMLAPYLASSGSARKRFAREARSAAGIVDDHVVPIHNVESESDHPFLVMQYVAGGSLQEKLDRNGPLTVVEIVRIGLQTAKGLAAAHSHGLIHRDVKPSNILLDEGVERALLTDFGLARTEDDACLTRSGFQPGTPHYMSPEQVRGEAIDGRSDLFGLGCVMYALCTGRPPFRAESGYAVLRRITDDTPRSIREVNPDIPEWFERIVMKLLEKDRDVRFRSSSEVVDTLGDWLAHAQQPSVVPPPASPAPTAAAKTKSERGIGKYLMGAAAGLLLLLAGVIIILETAKGTIRIESDVDGVPIRITQSDKVVESLTVTREGASVRVDAGDYVVDVGEGIDDIQVDGGTVSLARRGSEVVQITESKQRGPAEQELRKYEALSKLGIDGVALFDSEKDLQKRRSDFEKGATATQRRNLKTSPTKAVSPKGEKNLRTAYVTSLEKVIHQVTGAIEVLKDQRLDLQSQFERSNDASEPKNPDPGTQNRLTECSAHLKWLVTREEQLKVELLKLFTRGMGVSASSKAIINRVSQDSQTEAPAQVDLTGNVETLLDGVPRTVDGLAVLPSRLAGAEVELVHEIRTEDDTYTASYLIQYRGANYCLYMEKRRWKKLYEFTTSDEFAESERKMEPVHVAVEKRRPHHYQVAAIHAAAATGSDDEELGFEYRRICEYFVVPMVTIEEGFVGDVKRLSLSAPEGYTLEQVIESLKEHMSTKSQNVEASNE